jgi:phosphoribosylglycinamide formyltransferase-1
MSKGILIFASGGGSNARAIHDYAMRTNSYHILAILSDKKDPGIKTWAQQVNIPFHTIDPRNEKEIIEHVAQYQYSLIVLAGYLRLIPSSLIEAVKGRMVNIHPALLPKYGGKGMYGHFIHEAVIAADETESGLTIHWVSQEYDQGDYILQVHEAVKKTDTSETLATKILAQEHYWYPRVIEEILNQDHLIHP